MPEVVVLGSAQDGGVPHAGCLCRACRAARADFRKRRLPACLGIRSGDDWTLVDPTMAFEEQMHMLWSRRPSSAEHPGERYRPPERIIVTHAHTGHYAGLWQLDKSVLAAPGARVIAPPLTAGLLRANEPWKQMEADGYIEIEAAEWDRQLEAAGGVTVELVEVPHRSEWPTDTAALRIDGPSATLLYLPDIDFWDDWDRDVVAEVEGVDVAILDGSFWDAPTSPDVPHPPVLETMDRLQGVADRGETRIIFSHLNHSNPAVVAGSQEAEEVSRRGFEVAVDGLAIEI
ncbi:MAG: MBL fold metallo-hydrolase [Thermomicrobiales bacterium]